MSRHAPTPEALQELTDLFRPQGIKGLIDGTRAIPDFVADDFVIENIEGTPVPGRFAGREGLREWARETFSGVEAGGFGFVGMPTVIAPNVFVIRQRALGLGRETGLEIQWDMFSVSCWREGKIVYGKGFFAYDDALEEPHRWLRSFEDSLSPLASGCMPPSDSAIGRILVQQDDLAHRVRALGEEISRDYAGHDLFLVGVLKGAFFFLSDLMRHLDLNCEVDFMAVASYGSETDSSGVVRILKDLDASIQGREVLIVEDIVDSGLTLQYLLRTLKARDPASLEVCALLTKPERRKVDLPIRYTGFEIPNEFAIGYGLDHAERYRNLPYVAVLSKGEQTGG